MARQPSKTPTEVSAAAPLHAGVRSIGCVSYLNAKPLVDGLEEDPAVSLRLDVPSRLLADLEAGEVDVALCPVIDYHRAAGPLAVVPVGGIACEGPTLTVRLFSRVPIDAVRVVHADTDSHTSATLLRVLMRQRAGRDVELIDYDAREHTAAGRIVESPEAVLLIGDKVVTDAPLAATYPHQLDLGEAWHRVTGLPFVFAVWMAPTDADLGDLAGRLDALRQRNADRLDDIVDRHHAAHGWPRSLAHRYLDEILRYDVGPRELEAIERFSSLAADAGFISSVRPIRVHPATPSP